MLSVDPKDFLELAEELAHQQAREVNLRSAVSRAYYGAFNYLRSALVAKRVMFEGSAEDHGKLTRYFFNCGDKNLSMLGGWLGSLRIARNHADYDLNSPFDRRFCDINLAMARRAVKRFEETDHSRMRVAIGKMKITPAPPRRRTP